MCNASSLTASAVFAAVFLLYLMPQWDQALQVRWLCRLTDSEEGEISPWVAAAFVRRAGARYAVRRMRRETLQQQMLPQRGRRVLLRVVSKMVMSSCHLLVQLQFDLPEEEFQSLLLAFVASGLVRSGGVKSASESRTKPSTHSARYYSEKGLVGKQYAALQEVLFSTLNRWMILVICSSLTSELCAALIIGFSCSTIALVSWSHFSLKCWPLNQSNFARLTIAPALCTRSRENYVGVQTQTKTKINHSFTSLISWLWENSSCVPWGLQPKKATKFTTASGRYFCSCEFGDYFCQQ